MEARHGTWEGCGLPIAAWRVLRTLAGCARRAGVTSLARPSPSSTKFANDLSSPIGWGQIREDIEVNHNDFS